MRAALLNVASDGLARDTVGSVAMFDMTRTANLLMWTRVLHPDAQMEGRPQHDLRKEYASDEQAQQSDECVETLRDLDAADWQQRAYETAEKVHQNTAEGIGLLRKVAELCDCDMLRFMKSGRQGLSGVYTCMAFSHMFNGNLLASGHTAAFVAFAGVQRTGEQCTYGHGEKARLVLHECGSYNGVRRAVFTICSLVGMARLGVHDEYAAQDMHAAARDAPEWAAATKLLKRVDDALCAVDATRSCISPPLLTAFYSAVADWAEEAMHDSSCYSVLLVAFAASAFEVDSRAPAWVCDFWDAYAETHCLSSMCLWGAVEFVCALHTQRLRKPIGIYVALLIIFAGAVSQLTDEGDAVFGPVVFCRSAGEQICESYKSMTFFKAHRKMRKAHNYRPTAAAPAACSTGGPSGSKCGFTDILHRTLQYGQHRSRSEHGSPLAETRLRVCITNLSLKEQLMRSISGAGEVVLSGEGRKQLRRILVIACMAYPAVLHPWCHSSAKMTSYLIESKRKPDVRVDAQQERMTTAGNVENPYRDIQGASVISTLLFPICCHSLHDTTRHLFAHFESKDLDVKFKSKSEKRVVPYTTAVCIDVFLDYVVDNAKETFDAERWLVRSECATDDDYSRCAAVFASQERLVRALVATMRGSSMLWEKCQTALSRHDDRAAKKQRTKATLAAERPQEPDYEFAFAP